MHKMAVAVLIIFATIFAPHVALSAPYEVVLKCSLVYSSLFMSSRKANHSELLVYSQDRLRTIAPEILSYRGDVAIEQDFKRIAQQNRLLIDRLERDFYDAMMSRNNGKFRTTLTEVSACDRQLGIRESRIPSL